MSSENAGPRGIEEFVRDTVEALEPLPSRTVDLGAAAGCVLAQDVVAQVDLPRFTAITVDGYAVQAADTDGADPENPVLVRVVNEVATAGGPVLTGAAGLAVRVNAGAPLPEGADAVVALEDTDGNDHEVMITHPVEAGHGYVERGSEVSTGTTVLHAGRELRGGELALLAALGESQVSVTPRPRVALLPVGDELDPAGTDLPADSTRAIDATSPMLLAMLRRAGVTVIPQGIVGDDAKTVSDAVERAGENADVVLTTGGAGPGEQDHLRRRLSKQGVEFTDLTSDPCGVVGVGRNGKKDPLVIALPGQPAAAQVGFEFIVRPLLARLADHAYTAPVLSAVLAQAVTARGGREQVVPVTLAKDSGGGLLATPTLTASGTPGLGALGGADALARIPAADPDSPDPTLGAVGSWVYVLPLVPVSTVGAESVSAVGDAS